MATSSSLEAILEVARAALHARQVETEERAERIRAAVTLYVAAVEGELAADFAARNGLPAPTLAHTPAEAALALRAAVASLPELHGEPDERPKASQQVSPAPSSRLQSTEHDPVTSALLRDVQTLDLTRMPLQLFRVWAEELAARARALQEKGTDGDEVPGRVIRKLTAIAYEKGIADVFGLNRKHVANWDEVADRAKARRELAQSGGLQPLTQKIAIPEGLRAKVGVHDESGPPTISAGSERSDDDDGESVRRLELPLLRAATGKGPIVLVGGVVKQEKVALIQAKHGIEVEWIDTSRHGTQAIGTLEKRIREQRLAAVVVLQGLIGHKHFEPLVSAARHVGLPFSYADKAGMGSISRAFLEIEKQLGEGAADRTIGGLG